MQGEMVPVVLIPRFTSYCAGSRYETAPLDVTAYDRLVVAYECCVATGGPDASFQESHDGVTWFDLETTDEPARIRVDLTRRWLRVVVDLAEFEPPYMVTCWCAGSLRRRVS